MLRSEGRLLMCLGVRVVDNLGCYLGVPLLHKKTSKVTYAYILEKMKKKIALWNASQISFAGRVTLAQAVLNTMPLYAMQTSNVPLSTCSDMGNAIRGFVWGSTLEKQRLSKVAWSKITRPKEDGGLGFRDLRRVNLAFGMKSCWGIFKNSKSLWGRLICAKYKFDPKTGFDPCIPTSCTPFWRLICKAWPMMREKMIWALGTGKSVQFWNHCWVPTLDSSLAEVSTHLIPDHLLYKTVDFFVEGLDWDWPKFQHLLPEDVVHLIAAIMPPGESHGEDEAFWAPSSSGKFSIKSAYEELVTGQRSPNFIPWWRIWKWYGPQRIKLFFWLLLNNGVLINEERARRQLSSSGSCCMCGYISESGLHMLRDCSEAMRTWSGLVRHGGTEDFFDKSLSLTDWVIRNISSKSVMGNGLKWCTLFAVGCWYIWKKRCGFVFKEEKVCPEVIMRQIINMAQYIEEAHSTECIRMGASRSPMLISWRPPLSDTLKMNTDASLGGAGRAFGGGLFRDELGTWEFGFVVNIGMSSILTAEIWCLFYGVQLAKSRGIRKLDVESDSLVGVAMILGNFDISVNCRSIVHKVRDLLQNFESVVVRHVHREGNFAADFLSHYAYSFPRGVHVLENPPMDISSWLLHDRLGVSYIR